MSNLMEKKMCHVEIDFLLGVFEKSAHFPSYSERPIGKVENIKNYISRLVVNQSSKFEKLLNTRWYDYIVLNFQADRTRNAFTVNNFLRGKN